jgi:hypothetical protein
VFILDQHKKRAFEIGFDERAQNDGIFLSLDRTGREVSRYFCHGANDTDIIGKAIQDRATLVRRAVVYSD